ncbi:RHS repeat-associated core domain-containing protein [Cedecea sp.]|jgi:RHS repeat-associated protein|uniref:RHS repeat-associated core domain-containing protein n=1 Tax=Cedecea sp. TaxID=1970739 RepID=UPI002F3F8941
MKSCVAAFNGERLDPVSGTYHLGNGYRAYSPVLMRFICPDSWSPFAEGGINPYAYCKDDPINRADPSGHMSILGVMLTLASAIGLVTGIASFVAPVIMAGSVAAGLATMTPLSVIGGAMGIGMNIFTIAKAGITDKNPLLPEEWKTADIMNFAGATLGLVMSLTSVRSLFTLGRQMYKLGPGLMREGYRYEKEVRKAMGVTYWKRNETKSLGVRLWGRNREYHDLAGHRGTERIHGGVIPKYSKELRVAVPLSGKHETLLNRKYFEYAKLSKAKEFSQPLEPRHMANVEHNTAFIRSGKYNAHEMIEMGYISNRSDINNNLFRQAPFSDSFSIAGPTSWGGEAMA